MKKFQQLPVLAAFLLLFGAVHAEGQVQPQKAQPASSSTQKQVSVPLLIHEAGLLLVQAKINGVDAMMVVDTGAGRTMLDSAAKQELQVQTSQDTDHPGATGAGGAKLPVETSKGNTISLGSITVRDADLHVMDLSHVVDSLKTHSKEKVEISGVIGGDFLSAHQARIDYGSKRLYLYE